MIPDRSVLRICPAIEAHRVEVLPTTPSCLNALVRSDAVDRFDLSSLKRITYGTEVMPQFDADGWFDTQDLVEVDGDWLRILGRDSDLIKVAGQNVYPPRSSMRFSNWTTWKMLRSMARPTRSLGQIIVAKVVTSEPESATGLRLCIRRACAPKLAAFKLPTKVILPGREGFYSVRLKKKRQA